jgi:hypothetical protein
VRIAERGRAQVADGAELVSVLAAVDRELMKIAEKTLHAEGVWAKEHVLDRVRPSLQPTRRRHHHEVRVRVPVVLDVEFEQLHGASCPQDTHRLPATPEAACARRRGCDARAEPERG